MNRLVKVAKNNEDVASYLYDESGLRLKKQGNDKAVYYVFDTGGNVLYEQENREYLEYIYVLGKHFARVDGNLDNPGQTKKYFYHTDHLGSTVAVTDEAGQTVWTGEYTPFGGKHSVAGEMAKAAKFTGKDLDEDIGLYYFNARWYDQEIGRFISEDPIQFGLNWYTYGSNNPLSRIDPSGLADAPVNTESEWEFKSVKQGDWDGYTSYTYTYTNGNNETLKYLVYTTSNGLQHYMATVSGKNGRVYEQYTYTVDSEGTVNLTLSHVDRRTTGQIIWDSILHTFGAGVFGHESKKFEENPPGMQFLPYMLMAFGYNYEQGKRPVEKPQLIRVTEAEVERAPGGFKFNLEFFGDENATVIYKGTETRIYRGGSSFEVKAGEIRINKETGLMKTTHGVSLNVDPNAVSKYGGAYRIEYLPKGLKIVQRGVNPGHFEIVPAYEMHVQQYQSLLNQIKAVKVGQ
ncbi:MAG: hypothetical protein GXY86_06600 [Firmicutes bacterium]|nr:hypothetical protein [Bacillota bacterium]